MAKRQLRLRQPAEDALQAQADEQLSPEQVAAVIRQSSDQSVRNHLESVGIQLSAAQQYAVSQGLDADKIVIAHEGEGKRGVSASNLRIDQREQLREVIQGIIDGKIKVVWAYTHSRLFRDPFGIQSGTFMEICAKHHVKVVIDKRVYDFNDDNDRFIFGIEVAVAAKENKERAKWMREAKQRKALRGEYHGRPLTPGFIIDRDKASPTFGRYIPYESHVEVCRKLYARFRQLNGAFNILAAEVARMPFVFPDFEPWVDQRDVHQFRFKKVPGGYTIGKPALFRLLTAVEMVGYWKFNGELLTDENGNPKQVHEGIIPMDDWQFAFNALSFTDLQGENNTARIATKTTWKPVKKDRQEGLLVGLLTSPLGTVRYTQGKYIIAEQRPGKPVRSGTLTVHSQMVDTLFLDRLRDRNLKSGYSSLIRWQYFMQYSQRRCIAASLVCCLFYLLALPVDRSSLAFAACKMAAFMIVACNQAFVARAACRTGRR